MSVEKKMPESKKQANRKYLAKFSELKIRVLPNERDAIQQHAMQMNESTTGFIKRAIWEVMERDRKKNS